VIQVGLQLYMGVLRQKCVLSYDAFVNNTNYTNNGLNTSFEFYWQEINNTGKCVGDIHQRFTRSHFIRIPKITGIRKTKLSFCVVMPVVVENVPKVMFA
jgi:hypothetical protein